MKTEAKIMLDQPDKYAVGGAAAYGLFSYVLIPFVLYWVSLGFHGDDRFRVYGQLAHHGINFFMMLSLFREYLRDAFWTVREDSKAVLQAVTLCLIVPAGNTFFGAGRLLGALPIGEIDILMYGSGFLSLSPVIAGIVYVILAPVSITCMYYAVGFAPVCYKKPWLAYVVVALVLAIPRVINSILFWPAAEEFAIYLGQLPIHLLACRAYHKCDTVWAPIFCLMASNLVSCLYLVLFIL